jgi:hypothetical protein
MFRRVGIEFGLSLIRTAEIRSFGRGSELLMFAQSQNSYAKLRSSGFRTKLKDNLLIHPDSKLGILYMFFYHLDESAMVKSISYFNNFTKWIILVVNKYQ